jgi:HupE / UreJ protein
LLRHQLESVECGAAANRPQRDFEEWGLYEEPSNQPKTGLDIGRRRASRNDASNCLLAVWFCLRVPRAFCRARHSSGVFPSPNTARPRDRKGKMLSRTPLLVAIVMVIAGLLIPGAASAHNVSKQDASFVQSNDGPAVVPFMYLGAKHMVTGYDHLAFLVGVIFFLYRMKDIVLYVSLFTVGHSITLLAGVLGGIHANSYVIDAIIGFSVVYKAFDNMGGFTRLFGFEPNAKLAVLIFGLFHGFGLATKLQELDLARNGLVTNIVSFNMGVEIGQVLALTAVLIALSFWRTRSGFLRYAFATNTALMAVGFVLVGYQIAGYVQP